MSSHLKPRLAAQALPGVCFSHGAGRSSGRAAETRVCDPPSLCPLNSLLYLYTVTSVHIPLSGESHVDKSKVNGERHVLSHQEP